MANLSSRLANTEGYLLFSVQDKKAIIVTITLLTVFFTLYFDFIKTNLFEIFVLIISMLAPAILSREVFYKELHKPNIIIWIYVFLIMGTYYTWLLQPNILDAIWNIFSNNLSTIHWWPLIYGMIAWVGLIILAFLALLSNEEEYNLKPVIMIFWLYLLYLNLALAMIKPGFHEYR